MYAPTGSSKLPPRPGLPCWESWPPPVLPPSPPPASNTKTPAPLSHPPTSSAEQASHHLPLHTPHFSVGTPGPPCFANLISLWGCTMDSSWKEQAWNATSREACPPSQPCSLPITAIPVEIWAGPQVPISPGDRPHVWPRGTSSPVHCCEVTAPVGLAAPAECAATSLRLGMRKVQDPAETSLVTKKTPGSGADGSCSSGPKS